MKAKEFTEWRGRMGYNRTKAAEALGLGRNMPQRYEDGEAEIPLYVELACTAIERLTAAPFPNEVEVFRAQVYDSRTDSTVLTPSYRTQEGIEMIRGTPDYATRRVVQRAELDTFGRFYPSDDELVRTIEHTHFQIIRRVVDMRSGADIAGARMISTAQSPEGAEVILQRVIEDFDHSGHDLRSDVWWGWDNDHPSIRNEYYRLMAS